MHGDGYGSVDGHISLTYRIATLHVVYHKNESQILWFGKLVAFSPGIMEQLKNEAVCDRSEMVCIFNYGINLLTNLFRTVDSPFMCCGESSEGLGSRPASSKR